MQISDHFTERTAHALRRYGAWALLAAVVLVLLVTALLKVLQGAVQQGDVLRAHARFQGEAFWACNTLGSAADRHACRHQSLQPLRPAAPASQPPAAALQTRL